MKTTTQVKTAIETLRPFISPRQLLVLAQCAARGEEREFFQDKLCSLAELVTNMPKSYEQDGKGDDAIVSLRYFAGGQASWWITEKDAGCEDDAPEDKGKQHQAFGLADLFQDGGEVGYISIQEIISHGGEIDLYFTPCTLGEVRAKNHPAALAA